MTKEEKLTKEVKHLFNTIGAEDILRDENGIWYLEDKPLNEGQKKLLISEANVFTKTLLWKVLQDDVRWQANQAMFLKAKSIEDLVAGKLFLYVLDCFETRLKSMANGKGIFNPKG